MKRENALQYLPLIQAFAEGKTIQINNGAVSSPNWLDLDGHVSFNRELERYRIKPPEPRTFYVVLSEQGNLVGTYTSEERANDRVYRGSQHYNQYKYTVVEVREVIK